MATVPCPAPGSPLCPHSPWRDESWSPADIRGQSPSPRGSCTALAGGRMEAGSALSQDSPPQHRELQQGTAQPGGTGWWPSHRCISGRSGDTTQGTKPRWPRGPQHPAPHGDTATGRAGPAAAGGPASALKYLQNKVCVSAVRAGKRDTTPGESSSLQGLDPAQFHPSLQPQAAQGRAMGSGSRGCVHTSWEAAESSWGAGKGQERSGHIHRVIYPSEPGNFHAVQSQQAQALPGTGALHRGCLQRELETREDDENGTRGVEIASTSHP